MSDLSVDLITMLRRMAARNDTVPEMLRTLMQQLGREGQYPTALMRYLREAFFLDLQPLILIGSWHPITSVSGTISDTTLHEALFPHIVRTRDRWMAELTGHLG